MSILRSTRYNPGSVYNTPASGPNTDAWDPRPSMDEGGSMYDRKGYGQQTDHSEASARYEDAFAEGSHAYPNAGGQEQGYAQGEDQDNGYGANQGYSYGETPPQGQRQYASNAPGEGYIDHPAEARSRDPGQTPTLNQYQVGQSGRWGGDDGGLRRPDEVQSHPGEERTP